MSVHDRSAAGAPAAQVAGDLTSALSREIAAISELDLHGLRQCWRKLFRKAAPPHLPKYLLFRIIAYRIQANALGDLDRETARLLNRIAREHAAGRDPTAVIPSLWESPKLRPGTALEREHGGVLHRVTVLDGGFSWKGGTYGSLSEVARVITGTNWNGPRFFGLRERNRRRNAGSSGGRAS